MKKINQRVVLTKRMLREGLLRLLQQKPLEKIRISELCEESGINRATFYRHYQSPCDVLTDLELEFTEEMNRYVTKAAAADDKDAQILAMCRYFSQNLFTAKVVFTYRADEHVHELIDELYRNLWLKGEATQAGYDKDSFWLASVMLGGGAYCLLREWIVEDIPKEPEEVASLLGKFVQML